MSTWQKVNLFLSTLSLRRATPPSITPTASRRNFYPRSPCGERPSSVKVSASGSTFLSTLSLRRATKISNQCKIDQKNFYPRSPCGERREAMPGVGHIRYFYPRSPCGERRVVSSDGTMGKSFLSTLSLRRATLPLKDVKYKRDHFYPRSPCGERLPRSLTSIIVKQDFYPRSPCGERLPLHDLVEHFLDFYPRSPCGERRDVVYNWLPYAKISIHALLAESDKQHCNNLPKKYVFLSTLSLRRATATVGLNLIGQIFLSTLSLRRATAKVHKTVGHFCAYETNFMEIASSC